MHVYLRLKGTHQPTSSAKQTAHNYPGQPQHHFLQKGSVSVATLLPGDTGSCAADIQKRKLLQSNLHPAAGNFPESRINSGSRSYLRSASLGSPRDEFAIWALARRILWTVLQSRPLSASSPPHFTADSPRVSIDFTDFCTVNSAGVIGFIVIIKKNKLDNRKKKRPHGNSSFPSLGNPRTAAQNRKSKIPYKEKWD